MSEFFSHLSHKPRDCRVYLGRSRHAKALPSQAMNHLVGSNQALQRWLEIQAKPKVSRSDDPYEKQADRMAKRVLEMPEPNATSHYPPQFRAPRILRQIAGHDTGVAEYLPTVHNVISSPGRPLSANSRATFEPRFGYDFSQIRIHADARAAESTNSLKARAFTVGQDLVFHPGEFNPGDKKGQQLLAHELAHVVQQQEGITRPRSSQIHVMRQEAGVDIDVDTEEPADVDTYDPVPCADLAEIPSNLSPIEEKNWRRNLEDLFPRLKGTCYRVLREGDDNCCGYCQSRFSGGDLYAKGIWIAIPETVEAFETMFNEFAPIEDVDPSQPPDEAVLALYATGGKPTHTACRSSIQHDGKYLWESKLSGALPLIIHRLADIEGGPSGHVIKLYKAKNE